MGLGDHYVVARVLRGAVVFIGDCCGNLQCGGCLLIIRWLLWCYMVVAE